MNYPRVIIGGLSGDSGKTIVSCGLITHFKNQGRDVSGFKKGPDYIDAAWLSLALGKPARNLDTFMMGFPTVKQAFFNRAEKSGINIIEGNRGLFDGVDPKGKHSTAELARLLESPVIIVQDITKVTRTAAAAIAGCIHMDPDLDIKGVILNRVAGVRHEMIAREAIESETGIPVLGAIPKLPKKFMLPSRHLGLIMPDEIKENSRLARDLSRIIEENVDVSRILEICENAPVPVPEAGYPVSPPFDQSDTPIFLDTEDDENGEQGQAVEKKVKIGYFRDKSFSFYYPENLEMLERAGAEVIPIDPADGSSLKDLDTLYLGGGFPEVNLSELASKRQMKEAIFRLAGEGLPVYAECGGLMYLSERVVWNGIGYSLSGVLPVEVHMQATPQGHGYCEAVVDRENPFFKIGTVIRGHEFHYSAIHDYDPNTASCLAVKRGHGCYLRRDGLIYKNVFASYIHVHALATPEWVSGMIECARNYRDLKKTNSSRLNRRKILDPEYIPSDDNTLDDPGTKNFFDGVN